MTTTAASTAAAAPWALSVQGLSTTFQTPRGDLTAVDNVSLEVAIGESVGLVGESGSGKSVLLRSAMGLVGPQTGARREGVVRLAGREISSLPQRQLRRLWGSEIAVILQDPLSSLNPVRTIGVQLVETVRRHHPELKRREARDRAALLLKEVGIADPERRLGVYPHQMSGGMRQRVMIAMALSGNPSVLVADEPTTALDVTVQQQILELLDRERRARRMGLVLVTHDLAVVAGRTERVVVMYAGQVVESARTPAIFANPRMPYTRALLDAVPSMTGPTHVRLPSIPGASVDLTRLTPGCRFADRCSFVQELCRTEAPELLPAPPGSSSAVGEHLVRCHFPLPPGPTEATSTNFGPTAGGRS